MFIIGAGMAGLVASHIFRNRKPAILEAQSSLPNNHEALLRFRSTAVAEATGIQFKKALVRKAIVYQGTFIDKPNMFLSNTYSLKVTGQISDRSIWNINEAERWIAPFDFVQQMSNGVTISYSNLITNLSALKDFTGDAPVISTVPMPILMKIVGWQHAIKFHALPIWSVQVDLQHPATNVYQTIYYPDPEVPYYRASITGSRFIVEYAASPNDIERDVETILGDFGIIGWSTTAIMSPKEHRYGKIVAVDDTARKDFIYTMTREHNIYSLGRFAIWKNILLDEVVGDCRVIQRLIEMEGRRSNYHQTLATIGGMH